LTRRKAEDQEAGDRLEEGSHHHPAHDQLSRREPPVPARHSENAEHGRQRADDAARRDRPQAQRRQRAEQQHRRRSHAGAGGDPQQERIGQRVADEDLDHGSRRGKRGADQRREKHPRHPDLPDDLPGDASRWMTRKMTQYDMPDRGGAQRHRPDADRRRHDDDKQQ